MTEPLSLSDTVPETARDTILAGIKSHNDTLLGPTDRRDLFIPISAEDGSVDGGLVGYTGRGWLYVELLFVPERLRGQGMAASLLALAEEEARTRGRAGVSAPISTRSTRLPAAPMSGSATGSSVVSRTSRKATISAG